MPAIDPPAPVVRLTGVTKSYVKGDITVTPLEDASITVQDGDFVALVGPSGSGKSTLLNLAAGIDQATAGRVEVLGRDITRAKENDLAVWRRRTLGYVFQQFNLMPVLTAAENVELPLLNLPIDRERRRRQVATVLELVGLSDRAHHYPRQLSGGQEQRVAIARALVADPDLILADEPTGSLDRDSARAVMDLLVQLNERFRKTVIVVTHDPEVASRAKRRLRLDKGRLADDLPAEHT